MAEYKVLIKSSAIKELKRIPKKDLSKITEKIQNLSNDPRPPGCEKLTARNVYRIRYGIYRIVYMIEDDNLIIFVIKVGHRREIYR